MLTVIFRLFTTMSKSSYNLKIRFYTKGFSLIELMIGISIGLIATSGIISMLVHSINNNASLLKDIHLNQELRTIMSGVVKDIRRAGYWKEANGTDINPYSNIYINKDNNCILYSYDTQPHKNNTLGNEDNYGIRLIDQAIRIREKSSDCDTKRYWRSVSDNKSIKIKTLEFKPNNICSNISSSNRDCDTAQTGDILSIKHIIDVTLSGYLPNNKKNILTLKEKIVIRNSESKRVMES